MRTRIKICGITRPEDGVAAATLGVDAIGMVFHRTSPRYANAGQARAVTAALPAFVTRVGVFVDAPAEEIQALLDDGVLDVLQFHGNEPPDFCRAFRRPYIKAARVGPGVDILQMARSYPDTTALLLDTFEAGRAGGTGRMFDWDCIPRQPGVPLVLAGGLNPENVGEAIRRVHPWAVDVSGGVERSPGTKDADAISAFVTAVQRADAG